MGFRLANVDGRAALVSGENYYDLEELSGSKLGSDPMAALQSPGELSDLSGSLNFRCLGRRPSSPASASSGIGDEAARGHLPYPTSTSALTRHQALHASSARSNKRAIEVR